MSIISQPDSSIVVFWMDDFDFHLAKWNMAEEEIVLAMKICLIHCHEAHAFSRVRRSRATHDVLRVPSAAPSDYATADRLEPEPSRPQVLSGLRSELFGIADDVGFWSVPCRVLDDREVFGKRVTPVFRRISCLKATLDEREGLSEVAAVDAKSDESSAFHNQSLDANDDD